MQNNRQLINSLTNCINACEQCATASLAEEKVSEMKSCIKTDRDCADICSVAVRYLSRDSRRSIQIIGSCADICAECAEECEKHDHEHCITCAEACRQCEESCRAYLNT